jgi:hypothetical protein
VLEQWRQAEEQGPEMYAGLRARLPGLHFMSVTVFSDAHYDPILAIEVNFDDRAQPFWAQLEAGYGGVLQELIRCCKRPADSTGPLFDAAAAPGPRPLVAAYLEAAAKPPIAGHQGHRGLDRQCIEQDAALFLETRRILASWKYLPGATPTEIHSRLRAELLPRFPSLNRPASPRVTTCERLCDLARLVAAQMLLLLCLSCPGLLFSSLDARWLLSGVCVAGAAATFGVCRTRGTTGADAGQSPVGELRLFLRHTVPFLANPILITAFAAGFVAAYIALFAAVIGFAAAALSAQGFGAAWVHGARVASLGLASATATVPLVLLWLRRVERRDASQDDPPVSSEVPTAMAGVEDQVAQNHMSSLVLIKPGLLRAVLIRVVLRGMGLILRALPTDGYLGAMRTIHFAHWALAGDGGRLLFFSNFDGSWESYLSDFIEKAHGGLSLAWGNCVGFPPSRFLVLGGAGCGRQFKAWARHSMAPALFWFSAYPNETVNQIERQAALADGLRRPTLSDQEATSWIRTL